MMTLGDIAREMTRGQLIETAKEIVTRALVYHDEDGVSYSAMSCPVHTACTDELNRRNKLNMEKLMREEKRDAIIRWRKRKNRVKKNL